VGLHVGGVELSSKVQKSGQFSKVAPAPSATSHAATFIHAVQKSTSSGGSVGGGGVAVGGGGVVPPPPPPTSVPCISSKLIYPRVLNMPVKPAATVVLLLTASQAPPRYAVSKFGIRSQDPPV
jgi:hypothetical protein